MKIGDRFIVKQYDYVDDDDTVYTIHSIEPKLLEIGMDNANVIVTWVDDLYNRIHRCGYSHKQVVSMFEDGSWIKV